MGKPKRHQQGAKTAAVGRTWLIFRGALLASALGWSFAFSLRHVCWATRGRARRQDREGNGGPGVESAEIEVEKKKCKGG